MNNVSKLRLVKLRGLVPLWLHFFLPLSHKDTKRITKKKFAFL